MGELRAAAFTGFSETQFLFEKLVSRMLRLCGTPFTAFTELPQSRQNHIPASKGLGLPFSSSRETCNNRKFGSTNPKGDSKATPSPPTAWHSPASGFPPASPHHPLGAPKPPGIGKQAVSAPSQPPRADLRVEEPGVRPGLPAEPRALGPLRHTLCESEPAGPCPPVAIPSLPHGAWGGGGRHPWALGHHPPPAGSQPHSPLWGSCIVWTF